MKITKKLVFLALVCLLIFSPICLATNEPVSANNSANNTLDSQSTSNANGSKFYFNGQDVVVDTTVNGNVFAMGSTVTIKGEILGDLFVLANIVNIEDTAVIRNNIFAMGNIVTVKGKVEQDVYAFSQNFELATSGNIQRDANLYVGNAILNGHIKRDANLTVNTITVPEGAKGLVGGTLSYTSSQEFSIPEGAVLGEVKYTQIKENTPTTEEIISRYISTFITTILYAIVVILLATFFAPKFIEKANYALMQKSFVSTGIGILAIVLIPVFAIILLMTGFMVYISLAILAVYVLVLSITLAIFSMAIAKSIEKKLKNPSRGKFILFAILSAIVLWLLQIVPYIGGYMTLFIFVVGLGVFLFAFFKRKDVSEIKK